MIVAGLSDFLTGDLTDWVVRVIKAISYLGVALLVALENVFPPIPSEVVLPAAGLAAFRGDANLVGMMVAATIGSVIGAWVLYLIAAAIGHRRLHALVVRHGKWVGVKSKDLERAEAWFDNHSTMAVLICRCIPLIRSLVSIPAGFRKMNPVQFTVYTAIGSAVWNVILIGAGYALGNNWKKVGDWVGVLQYIVIAAILGLLAYWVWRRFISPTHKAQRRAEELQEAAEVQVAEAILDSTD